MTTAKIKDTEYEDVVRRMIAAEWTSTSIALYVTSRYGTRLHDSTVRVYRLKNGDEIRDEYPDLAAAGEQAVFKERALSADSTIDTLGKLQEMIRLQEARIVVDVAHEETMGKLFGSTRHEIATLAKLLEQYHGVLQDWGVVPTAGVDVNVNVDMPQVVGSPVRVIDVLERDEMDDAIGFARLIAGRSQEKASGNGEV